MVNKVEMINFFSSLNCEEKKAAIVPLEEAFELENSSCEIF